MGITKPRTLGIATRISLAIGLLLFLFFVTSAVAYLLTKRIEQDVVHWIGVEKPRHDAVLAMQAGLAETARSVAAYAHGRGPLDKEGGLKSEAEFERSAASFMRLASSGEQQRLGNEIEALSAEYRKLSAEIIAATDREEAESLALSARLNEINESIEDKRRAYAERDDRKAAIRLKALLGMEREITEILGVIEGRRLSGEHSVRDQTQQPGAGVERFLAHYRESGPGSEDRLWLDSMSEEFSAAAKARDSVMALAERRRALLTDLETRRREMATLLGDQVAPLMDWALLLAKRNVDFSTYTAIFYLIVMTCLGIGLGGGTALLLSKGIVGPIRELRASADAIGRGMLEHRIPVRSDDEIGQLAASFNRMAESRQRSEEALQKLAQHDELTGLPNRNLFYRRLVEGMDHGGRADRRVAVHILDLDHFKDINDTLGHPSGDLLLRHVAERLKGCVRTTDTVARLGGDEFAIVQTNLQEYDGIPVLANRMIDTLAKPFDLEGERVHTGASIGITVFPYDGREAEQLLKNADLALYRAKQEGRNNYQLYDPEMNAEIHARKALEQDLRLALEGDELFLNYQPQLELESGRIVGAEALVRWRHKDRGMVPPGEFIPVAEQTGLIIPLTEVVLRQACRQTRIWQDAGLSWFKVTVNLSAMDFKRKDLIALVTGILEQSAVDPRWLELEITEGSVMSGDEKVIDTLQELKALGVALAIDDFGTGYSSMGYLKRFPVDRLKIDQSFVRDILTSKEDASITEAMISLGHSLGLRVIAEGVETQEQLEFLRAKGCDEAQGYCFSRPLDPDAFATFVTSHARSEVAQTSESARGL